MKTAMAMEAARVTVKKMFSMRIIVARGERRRQWVRKVGRICVLLCVDNYDIVDNIQ